MDDLSHHIASIPALHGFDGWPVRMGGLTNRVHRLGPHVLRIPGEGTEASINRTHGAAAARLAADCGVGAPGLIQLANANPADDFRVYAETRFARCRALKVEPEFAIHLAAINAGA